MENTESKQVVSVQSPLDGTDARIVQYVPKSATFELRWNGYDFFTWRGELVARPYSA